MDPTSPLLIRTAAALATAGCVAAEEEAEELIEAAGGDLDRLTAFVERRCAGEPPAWIVGHTAFCGLEILVDPGVYVPRWQSEPLAERAAELLPEHGIAIDLGTGSGAIAALMASRRKNAMVIGTEIDPIAMRCAARNGVEVVSGPLFSGVARSLSGRVDVVVGVLPYVPTEEIHLLPRDVVTYEPRAALDGGSGGLEIVCSAVAESARWLRTGGTLLLEVGGEQAAELDRTLATAGFAAHRVIHDTDGDARGIEAVAVVRHLSR